MHLNLVVMCGRLAAPVEIRTFDSGSRFARLLVTVRSDEPLPRVDVVPVSLWNPSAEFLADLPAPGQSVFVAGAVQRRFWDGTDGRRSRIEIVAGHVEVEDDVDGETREEKEADTRLSGSNGKSSGPAN